MATVQEVVDKYGATADKIATLTDIYQTKNDAIDQKVNESQQRHIDWINSGNSKYLGSLVDIDIDISATQDMDAYSAVKAAYDNGHKHVRLIVPDGITCNWDNELTLQPGHALQIVGQSKTGSRVKFRRAAEYIINGIVRHQISTIALRPGCVFITNNVSLIHVQTDSMKAAPYGHGMLRVAWLERSAGNIQIFCMDTNFATFDCVLYLEGATNAIVSCNLAGCNLDRIVLPGWFDNPNVGWVGVGSWGNPGNALVYNNRAYSQTADDQSGAIYGFINCWSLGTDVTTSIVATPYTGSYFMGIAG